jgi:hypothetical protein
MEFALRKINKIKNIENSIKPSRKKLKTIVFKLLYLKTNNATIEIKTRKSRKLKKTFI